MSEHGNGGSERGVPYSHFSPRDMSMRNQTSGASRMPGAASSSEQQHDIPWPAESHLPAEPDVSPADAYLTPDPSPSPTHIDPNSPAGRRFYMRRLIQEFLASVPRSEPETCLTFLRLDGTVRVLTRAELSEIIDNLRPFHRQIVRLAIEERWPRQRVCDYLRVSLKTFERKHQEVLDLLAQL